MVEVGEVEAVESWGRLRLRLAVRLWLRVGGASPTGCAEGN